MGAEDSDRCGFQLQMGLTDPDIDSDQCDRPLWEDHDHCIWHASVDGKTAEQLEAADPASEDDFDGAYLRNALLTGVDWFEGASLVGANLTGADVNGADFSEANLMLAKLTDLSAIGTDFSGANMEGAVITNADIRRATFEDARLFETVLTDVHIGSGTVMGDDSIYDRESLDPDLTDEHPLTAAAWTYRQLQELYQANALPQLARQSYYKEKDARRRLAWTESDIVGAVKWELSRWVMRYGDSPYRVLLTSLVVIVTFALMFPLTGGIQEIQNGQSITYSLENPQNAPSWWIGRIMLKSLYFSVVTFATLGYGDIQPIGLVARLLAGAEALLGALLAALLVFVLARIVTW